METTQQASTIEPQPTPVDDLERRLAILKASGVRAYKDGSLEIVFGVSPLPTVSAQEKMERELEEANLSRFADADAGRLGV